MAMGTAELRQTTYPDNTPEDRQWRLLFVWAWNGFVIVDTDHIWQTAMDMHFGHRTDVTLVKGDHAPWTSRYVNDKGDLMVVTRPRGTLD